MYQLHHGECLAVMASMPDNSVDSIVTDPPYGLSFMGKKWDYAVPAVEIWAECLRVLKPGGHLLAFASTRTQHRMACRIEDAGFELRDMVTFLYNTNETAQALIESLTPDQLKLMDATFGRDSMAAWSYGSGFPKSHNLDGDWQGWGTALKPAIEPITVARKPFKGTVAANLLAHGCGAINIDESRVPFSGDSDEQESKGKNQHATFGSGARKNKILGDMGQNERENYNPPGRWPANLIHDGSDEVMQLFPESSVTGKRSAKSQSAEVDGTNWLTGNHKSTEYTDQGSAARFFYCAKASKKDRGEGNTHPTVKPTDLMAYLCRLVTPPCGVVLDPFMGSGSTGNAALREGFDFIGIEREADYVALAKVRLAAAATY